MNANLEFKEGFHQSKSEAWTPDGWSKKTLSSLTSKIGSGATPRGGKESYKKNGISLIRSQNILDLFFEPSGLAFIDDEQAQKLANVKIKNGDILINITGDSVARVCRVPLQYLPARVNQHVAIIRADREKSDPRFLEYFLVTRANKGELLALASAGATRNALTKGMLEDFTRAIPKVPEQKAIAGVLGSLDDKIELLREQNETLEALAQTLFKHWFIDFNFPDKNGKPYKDSGGDIDKLKETSLDSFINYNPVEKVDRTKEYLFFDMKCLQLNQLSLSNGVFKSSSSNTSFREGDTLLAKITPCLENGKTGLVQDLKGEEIARGSTEFIVMRPKENGSKCFNYCLARNSKFRRYAIRSMSGSSGRQRVPVQRLKSYSIINEQGLIRKFETAVSDSFQKIKVNSQQIETLTHLRDTLLPKLMSGEIRIPTEVL